MRAKVVRELNELQTILAYIDSHFKNIHQFLNDFANQPNEINMDDPEPDDGLVDTPLGSPFLDSNVDSDNGEVLNELEEYGNAGKLCQKEDIREFIIRDMTNAVMGKPFRKVTKLEYDCDNGLISFTKIFNNHTFQMPRTIPRNAYEKNKFMYKNCLSLGPEYQVDEKYERMSHPWACEPARSHVRTYDYESSYKTR
nr:hypothetical protein [Tanacetum cinerariifolium]